MDRDMQRPVKGRFIVHEAFMSYCYTPTVPSFCTSIHTTLNHPIRDWQLYELLQKSLLLLNLSSHPIHTLYLLHEHPVGKAQDLSD